MKDTLLKFFTEQENRLLTEFSICLDVKQRMALCYRQISAILHKYLQRVINEWKLVQFSPVTE